MRVLGLDIETCGLDTTKDHITEVAWCVRDVGDPKPLIAKTFFVKPQPGTDLTDYVPAKITALTKITVEHLVKAGRYIDDVLGELAADIRDLSVDIVAGHNALNFDRPFLEAKCSRESDRIEIFQTPQWLDTSVDIVYPEDCRHTNLLYVAAYYGFVNPFPHSALFDVMTMLKVLEHHDIEEVARRARIPWIYVAAKVSYDARDLAKARRYAWENLGTEKFPKTWVKKIKETDFEKEKAEAPFDIVRIAV